MKQLKLNTAWLKDTEAFSDVEMGRLFRGMLKYASSGEEPKLTGNERMMWPKARAEIDEQRRSHDRQQAGNRKRHDEGMMRHDEASCGMMRHDEASCGIEKAYPPSPPTPPVIPPKKERKKTSPKGESKERSLSPAMADALSAFREMRNRMRKPMTPLAVDLLIQKLQKLAPGDEEKQVAMLMQSIENGWTGVYELKQEQRNGRPKSQTFNNYDENRVVSQEEIDQQIRDMERWTEEL